MKINTSFGERIKGIRIEKGVSLTQAAADMGISQGALSDYERDRKLPGYDVIQKLSHYYGVCYEYLFGESEAKKAENSDIMERLGLSEYVIEKLSMYRSHDRQRSEMGSKDGKIPFIGEIEIINRFLKIGCDQYFFGIIALICTLMRERTQEFNLTTVEEYSANSNEEIRKLYSSAEEYGLVVLSKDDRIEHEMYRAEQIYETTLSETMKNEQTPYLDALNSWKLSLINF